MESLRDAFDRFWLALRDVEVLAQAIDWVLSPTGSSVVSGTVLLLIVWRWWHGRRPRLIGRRGDAALRHEIRELTRAGDWCRAGERWLRFERPRKALDAFRRGGCHAQEVDVLLQLGQRHKAKDTAKRHGVWARFAELAREDGELTAAAEAFERAEQPYAAAQCFERAKRPLDAGRAYLRAGMAEQALPLLLETHEDDAVDLLERTVRSTSDRGKATGKTSPTRDLRRALERVVHHRLRQGRAEHAFALARDAGAWELALPIARDQLPPRIEVARLLAQHEAWLDAAEIYDALGDADQANLHRAEHHVRAERPREAAEAFERAEALEQAAEQWALAGNHSHAAALYERIGDVDNAASLYGMAGDTEKQEALRAEGQTRQAPGDSSTARMRPRDPRDVDTTARYVLHEEIGRGAMGVVYRAEDTMLDRNVAYKLLPQTLAHGEDVLAEARAAAKLSHPNIVQVFDAGHGPHGAFIVMELVEGRPFSTELREHKLSIRGVLTVGRQICAALAHAHERQLVHRDLKPANLMLTDKRQVKLTDFGLARAYEGSGVETRPAGTPFYMAPEQITGELIDPRTDLYSLGCVLYELLCREPPFTGGGLVGQHLHAAPPDPRTRRPDTPAQLAELVLRCLAKEPAKRPQRATEIDHALYAIQTALPSAATATAPPHSF